MCWGPSRLVHDKASSDAEFVGIIVVFCITMFPRMYGLTRETPKANLNPRELLLGQRALEQFVNASRAKGKMPEDP